MQKRMDIAVVAMFDENGEITPLFVYKDGKYYKIDKVMSVRRYAPSVACVSPFRYDCIIEGKSKSIYRDGHPSHKWFSVVEDNA